MAKVPHNIRFTPEVWELVEKTGNASQAVEDAILAYFSAKGQGGVSPAEKQASEAELERLRRQKAGRRLIAIRRRVPYCGDCDIIFQWRTKAYTDHAEKYPDHETNALAVKVDARPPDSMIAGGDRDGPAENPVDE